jgi:hypothetical protein
MIKPRESPSLFECVLLRLSLSLSDRGGQLPGILEMPLYYRKHLAGQVLEVGIFGIRLHLLQELFSSPWADRKRLDAPQRDV